MASTLIQTKGLKRPKNTLDKFYTSPSIVKLCLQQITQHLSINPILDLVIEPSAGNGAFIDGIKSICHNYLFYDISPAHDEIAQQDYLTLKLGHDILGIDSDIDSKKEKKIHVIGNPPFGKQSSLAIKFIKKSTLYCDSMSFILPKSFKKDSMLCHFPLNFHLIKQVDLPNNSFLVNGIAHNVPCVFQIWEKRADVREVKEKLVPNQNYSFVKKNENPDISFRRVGVYAGNISRDIENKSAQSHYFIKSKNIISDQLLEKLNEIKYSHDEDTVGAKSISKQELIKELNMIL